MKVLFHTVNNMGLGHLRRTCAIITYLKRSCPEIQPLIVSNASFPKLVESVPTPAVLLPHPRTAPSAAIGRLDARVSPAQFQALALNCIAAYKPKLTVFDTYVGGHLAAKHRDYTEKSCLVFRKCREGTIRQYVRTSLFGQFDLVVIPHSREEFLVDLPDQLVLAMEAQATCVYTGPIIYPEGTPDDDIVELCDSIRDTTVILVACGGGGYDSIQNDFIRAALRGARLFGERNNRKVSVVLVTGPFSKSRVVEDGVIYVNEPVHVQYLMKRSDLVITHGGYNSVNEVLASGSRAIFTAFYRKTEDQQERITALIGRPATAVLDNDAAPEQIAVAVAQIIDLPKPPVERFTGGDEVARVLTDLLIGSVDQNSAQGIVGPYSLSLRWDSLSELGFGRGPNKVKIDIGSEDPLALSERVISSLQILEELGIEFSSVSFTFDEDPAVTRLPALAKLLIAYKFDRLLGRVLNTRELDSAQIFFALESCRALRPDFDYDFVPEERHELSSMGNQLLLQSGRL